MLKPIAGALPLALCLLAPATALAGEPIPVESFAKHPPISLPRLSPDGKYLAVRVDDEADGSQHMLMVYRIADMQPVSMLRMPIFEVPADITWVSPTRLVVEKGKLFGSAERPELTGEVIATDVDGKHQRYLYGWNTPDLGRNRHGRDEGWGTVAGVPTPNNDHFYLDETLWNNEKRSTVYDVDSLNGARHLIGQIDAAGMDFMIGKDGQARYAFGDGNDFRYAAYRRQGDGWVPLKDVGYGFVPLAQSPDQSQIYAFFSGDGGPHALVQQPDQGEGIRQLLASDEFGDVGHLEWSAPPLQPFAASALTGVPHPQMIRPELPEAKLYASLSDTFKGEFVHFIDFSADGGRLLFSVSSDRDPGSYYLLDTRAHKANKLFSVAPWIDPAKMATRVPMHFKASDGLPLEAIVTLPPGLPAHELPMVLLPHGGPHGISDDWFYDDDAQFLASRGYLVLQVNYRGSGGRGPRFEQAGHLQWGGRIQQDLIDGVRWAIDRHLADPRRICIYGASFGGYSALMAPIRAPGLFKCAVGYAGIYDLAMMYKKGDIQSRKTGQSYLQAVIGRSDAELDANSPDKLAAQLDLPILLVHGEADQRAPFAQAQAMRSALDAAHKSYEWLAVPGEGHGFYKEANRVIFYQRLQAFLAAHIGPGQQP